MEKLYETTKSMIVNYKLDLCCWVAPVKVGLIIIGCFNIFVAIISLIGAANESFTPILMKIQETLMEDYVTKPVPIVAYSAELGFSVLLLCAIYRKDLVLMYVYMRYSMAAIIMSILVYSMVIAAIDVLLAMVIVLSVAYQCYVLLIVRSAIVVIKAEKRKYELPTLVTYNSGNPNQPGGTSEACHIEVVPSPIQEKETQGKNGDIKDVKIEKDGKSADVQKDGTSDDAGNKNGKLGDVESTPGSSSNNKIKLADAQKKDGKSDDAQKKDGKSEDAQVGKSDDAQKVGKTDNAQKVGKSDDAPKDTKSDDAQKDGKSDDIGKKNGKSDNVQSISGIFKKNKSSKKDLKKELKESKLKTVEESPKE